MHTESQLHEAIKRFGNYRTVRCQQVAGEGPSDGISGAHIMALGLRETGLSNINGGAVWDKAAEKWVAADPEDQDTGPFQISRAHHPDDLVLMPGVREGTWRPVVPGKRALDAHMCPRFEDALQFTMRNMHENMEFADDHGVVDILLPRFAVAAHNAGPSGALKGLREGNIDKYTAHGNYSKDVLDHTKMIKAWLREHINWQA